MIYITGLLMAIADSVPGISGGTIALILNEFDNLIEALNNVLSGKKNKEKSIKYLLKLVIGWFVGFILSVFFITNIIQNHIYQISSLFIALIIFSIYLIIKQEEGLIQKWHNIYLTIFAMIIVVIIAKVSLKLVDVTIINNNFIMGGYYFISGILAAGVMLLPGMSGSTILLIMGIYFNIMMYLKEIFTFNFSHLGIIIIFGVGVIIGFLIATKLLAKLLVNHKIKLLYIIIGLMIGSLYAIIIGPVTGGLRNSYLNLNNFSIIAFICGLIIMYSLNKIKGE